MATAEILFLAADPREFAGVLPFWQQIRPVALPVHWARTGIRKGRPVMAIANGAGWERARLASEAVPGGELCNLGFCGAFDPALQVADIVVSSHHLPVRCSLPHVTGPIFSSRHIVGTVQEKQRLHADGYVAVEMEAAGITQRPFFCIKAVSDLARETFENDFEAALLPDGRIDRTRLIAGALKKPFRRIPEMIRLARRTSLASNRLGEFLDACDF